MTESRTSNEKDNDVTNKVTTVLFIIYLVALCWILLFKLGVRFSYMEDRRVNLVPFSNFFIPGSTIHNDEMILNAVIFLPLGIYAGVLFKRWAWPYKIVFFFLVSLLVEALQYILKVGAFDTTDIITNLSGGIIGLMILKGIEKLFNNGIKTQKFINIIAAMGTVTMILLLVLLKLNKLPIKYQ